MVIGNIIGLSTWTIMWLVIAAVVIVVAVILKMRSK